MLTAHHAGHYVAADGDGVIVNVTLQFTVEVPLKMSMKYSVQLDMICDIWIQTTDSQTWGGEYNE